MTDPLGQSQVLAYLKGLSESGRYQFTIISFEKEAVFKQSHTIVESICQKAGIKWYPLSYTPKPPVISTFRDVQRMQKLAVELAKKNQYSIVHCRSYIPSLVGMYLKKKMGIPFLFDMRGFWADERLDGEIWRISNPVYRFIYNYFKRKEKQFLLNADHIVSLTQNAKDEIISWRLSSKLLPITVIPCCVDMELFNPELVVQEKKKRALKELDIPVGANIISYIGSLGTWYMLKEMLAFVKEYGRANENTYFLVLTGEPPEMVMAAAENAGINRDILRIKKVIRTEMPLYISLGKISIFFIKPSYSKKASSPVKQGELMAMGVPVVCNSAVGDSGEVVERYNAGIVIDQFSPEAYKLAIEKLKKTEFSPGPIIKGAKDYFSLEKGVQTYMQVYQEIDHG